ncbi:MAG: diaminopropionate ammonia-lyase [Planctomycetes bacterium]|nr:diaminopropionate ammonia-lyase [Planctomycetota bacterium]
MTSVRLITSPYAKSGGSIPDPLPGGAVDFHTELPGYAPTPLVELRSLAAELGVGRLFLKDESKRFDLKAFKVLGASYAIYRWVAKRCAELGIDTNPREFLSGRAIKAVGPVSFTTATDGNHGRAVAWTAGLLKCPAVIYVPDGTAAARTSAMEELGANVITVKGDYDDAVKTAAEEAGKYGRQIISDTSWEGYTEVPGWIQEGYFTLFHEAAAQMAERGVALPDVILVQAGVGALAAAAAGYYPGGPVLISVEPVEAACLFESVQGDDGTSRRAAGNGRTIMAGLNCATPSSIAWPVIRDRFEAFAAIGDEWASTAMRRLAHPRGQDAAIVSGESGAAGLGALAALMKEVPDEARAVGLNEKSVVMVINTEGDTDPEKYNEIVSG